MSKDTIYREDAILAMANALWHYPNDCYKNLNVYEFAKALAELGLRSLPSAQPTEASCWGCSCPKMERLKEQKTFSEMVHLHDAETHDKRTKTNACDLISRQEAIDIVRNRVKKYTTPCVLAVTDIQHLPSAQPDFDMIEKIDKEHDDGYKQGYMQAKSDYEADV